MIEDTGRIDVRCIPTYSASEIARYLSLPVSTVRSWVSGISSSGDDGGTPVFKPVIERPDPQSTLLSFENLIEIHSLSTIRREHRVSLQRVREALDYIETELSVSRPLANVKFQTDQKDLYIEALGKVITVSGHKGQLAIPEVVAAYLDRIEADEQGLAARLYPFTRIERRLEDLVRSPKLVVIDPHISFGRPVLKGSGTPTAILADRFKAGESIKELADDYGFKASLVEEAIRYEQYIAA